MALRRPTAKHPPSDDHTFHRCVSRGSYDSFWRRSPIATVAILLLVVILGLNGYPRCGIGIAVVAAISLTGVWLAEVLGF
jgi:hypothetical protein